MSVMNLNVWKDRFEKGEFDICSTAVQIEAGWFDWFCNDESLRGKTAKLGKKLLQLMGSPKIDCEKSYVFFKNNCPMWGSLYDDFRICDIETGDVLYCVTPSSGHNQNKRKAGVWGKENDFKEALVEGTWRDVKKFFGVK